MQNKIKHSNMKTTKFLSIAFTLCLALLSCGGGGSNDPTPDPTPQPPTPVTPKGKFLTKTCDMTADASETIVTLTGLNSEVTSKSGSAAWLTTSLETYTTGTPKVKVACTQNLATEARQQDVTFIATNDTLVLTVRQGTYTGGGTDVNDPNDTPTDQPAYGRQQ